MQLGSRQIVLGGCAPIKEQLLEVSSPPQTVVVFKYRVVSIPHKGGQHPEPTVRHAFLFGVKRGRLPLKHQEGFCFFIWPLPFLSLCL